MAEENVLPRILGELAGPLSRARDVAEIQRRLAVSPLGLPPGPGEAHDVHGRPGALTALGVCARALSLPDGWDTWPDEQKAAYNGALRAQLARLKGTPVGEAGPAETAGA